MSTETKVSDTPCPRCACHLTRTFNCNCGEIHSDYCVNCGRFVGDRPNEKPSFDPRFHKICAVGKTMHEH